MAKGSVRKKHPIADRKLKTVTAEYLQEFVDLLSFGGTGVPKTLYHVQPHAVRCHAYRKGGSGKFPCFCSVRAKTRENG